MTRKTSGSASRTSGMRGIRPDRGGTTAAGATPVGDHDLFIGEVLLVHIDEDAINAAGHPDTVTLDRLISLRGGSWRIGEKVQ